jgi:hypothetical protein
MKVYRHRGPRGARPLRTIARGTEGAISWDGLLDDNSKGRIGPYIVVFEVFDLAGNTERYKKTVRRWRIG